MEKELARMCKKVGRNMQMVSGVLLWASVYNPVVDEWYMLKVTTLMIALTSSNLILQKGYQLSYQEKRLKKK